MKLFVTYGNASPVPNNYSVVEGDSIAACYKEINEVTQGLYAFAYTEEDFVGQVDRYGLTQIPLQMAPVKIRDVELTAHQLEVMRDRSEEYNLYSGYRRYQPKLIQHDEEEAPRNYDKQFAKGDDNG